MSLKPTVPQTQWDFSKGKRNLRASEVDHLISPTLLDALHQLGVGLAGWPLNLMDPYVFGRAGL